MKRIILNMNYWEIQKLVAEEKERLGSNKRVAVHIGKGVSEATISLILSGKFAAISDKMWQKIATGVGYKEDRWKVIATLNTRLLYRYYKDAKAKAMWVAISHPAGGGKTASAELFSNQNKSQNVFLLRCREWSRLKFTTELGKVLGIETPKGAYTSDEMLERIIEFFEMRAKYQPLLIIDEADKLHPQSLRMLIPLYNALEDSLGVVIQGTENLEKEINTGVKYNKKGYDEISSRFGRKFMSLYGATKNEVAEICKANGIDEAKMHTSIFQECKPVTVELNGQFIPMVKDFRRLKRAIQKELLLRQEANTLKQAS